MKANEILTEAVKQRLDPKCWKGKHKEGTKIKGGVRVNNCVPNESVAEGHADQQRKIFKKNGKPVGEVGIDRESSPGNGQWYMTCYGVVSYGGYDSYEEAVEELKHCLKQGVAEAGSPAQQAAIAINMKKHHKKPKNESLHQEFDMIENIIEQIADQNAVDVELVWEDLSTLTDDELYVFAVTQPVNEDWQKANKRDKTDGMSRKAVNAYRREHPGSKLKTAVTTKPSKLKRGSKASKRRSSYCSRSAGQQKMHHIDCSKTPDKAICKARRRWNC